MTQLKDGGRQPRNREERSLSASPVVARRQGNGWDEPCKLRGLRTVLWAAGGEIPPADPAAWNPQIETLAAEFARNAGGEIPHRPKVRKVLMEKAVFLIIGRSAPGHTPEQLVCKYLLVDRDWHDFPPEECKCRVFLAPGRDKSEI
jgi:hypothetical protein